MVRRIAHTLRVEGERLGGYFADREEADAFEAELDHLLVTQKGAFNSPVWFNLGLWHEYGIEGSGGAYFWNPATDAIEETANAYQHPQCSACFIQSVDDDLMSIFQLVKNEARLFKYGSGTGTNFSRIRSKEEKLSGGGTSSGLMSFLEVLDRAAGATKSGGTTRRAAKMVCLDMDHPEIERLHQLEAPRGGQGPHARTTPGVDLDEAVHTVSGQNANNSVRDHRRLHGGLREGRRLEDHLPHRRASRPDTLKRQGPHAPDRPGGLGVRRPRASSSTPPSTAGTPARPPTRSTPATPAPSTCSWTTRPATSPA